MRIPLREIYIGDRQRKDYGGAELQDLQKDMQENGQIQAITVRPPNESDRSEEDYKDEPWVLIAGGRRLHVAWLLGWEPSRAMRARKCRRSWRRSWNSTRI
jgi:ParB-like chromosome segregation protein Spo0J